MKKISHHRRIQETAARVENALKGKMTIHRYDAFSTNSVYLKFDYGVANSLRISDHAGYDYLAYRFNIIVGLDRPYIDQCGKYPREFYPASMTGEVIERILAGRAEKVERYRDYPAIVERAKSRIDHTKSFWQCCREVQ